MWRFNQAKFYYKGRLRHDRLVIGIHDMEVKNGAKTAESVTDLAARGGIKASFHFAVDVDSINQGVLIADTAWAAPGANADGVHVEIAGFSRLTREQWLLPDSDKALNWAALVVAELIVTFRRLGATFLVKRLTKAQLLGGKVSGISGHHDINDAFHKSTHTDPGNNFPWPEFLAKVEWWISQIDADAKWTPSFR